MIVRSYIEQLNSEEDHRDLTTAFSEFASAISNLINIAETDSNSSLTDAQLIPSTTVRPRPILPSFGGITNTSASNLVDDSISNVSPASNSYDVTPTNELSEQSYSPKNKPPLSLTNSLYMELDVKVEEFLRKCPPTKSIETLLDQLKRPQSIHIYQKLIGRSKSTPGSLNEVTTLGKLRPLRVPRQLKEMYWDARLRRSSVKKKPGDFTLSSGRTVIPRRERNKLRFLRDDPERCKSMPLTKVEIQALTYCSQADGFTSLPSVTNLNELGLYEYVDVDLELKISMQKMFISSGGAAAQTNSSNHSAAAAANNCQSNSNSSRTNATTAVGASHTPLLLKSKSQPEGNATGFGSSSISTGANSSFNGQQTHPTDCAATKSHQPVGEKDFFSSAASSCANIDVSQLILELCSKDDDVNFYYDEGDEDDEQGGGIRDTEPSFDDDQIELKDEYYSYELINPHHQQQQHPSTFSDQDASPSDLLTSNNHHPHTSNSKNRYFISRNGGISHSHGPPPVVPCIPNKPIIERSATFPRTLDEITECANE